MSASVATATPLICFTFLELEFSAAQKGMQFKCRNAKDPGHAVRAAEVMAASLVAEWCFLGTISSWGLADENKPSHKFACCCCLFHLLTRRTHRERPGLLNASLYVTAAFHGYWWYFCLSFKRRNYSGVFSLHYAHAVLLSGQWLDTHNKMQVLF